MKTRFPMSRRDTDFQIESSVAKARKWRLVTAKRRSDLASNKDIMQIQMSSCNQRESYIACFGESDHLPLQLRMGEDAG